MIYEHSVGRFVGRAYLMGRLVSTSLQRKLPGTHPDGRGLYLQVKNGGRSWLYRFMIDGKGRWMGLGPFPDVSLAQARRLADEARRLLRNGIDPIDARRQSVLAAKLDAAQTVTFNTCAMRYIEAHRESWRNPKHAAQWTSTLETYAYPVLGSVPVQAIDTGLVMQILEPIWRKTPETATRVRQRIEATLDWATAHNYRSGENPARWRGHLDKLLPKPSKVRAVKHHAAMPYAELPQFFTELLKKETISAKALAFTILTAARSGETRGARANEIDFSAALWIVPAERTKSNREHRVPLAPSTLAILRSLFLSNSSDDRLLFPNPRGKMLSDTAMRKYLQEDMKQPTLTVHGFRSSFRDWAAEQTNFPRELAEASLAHSLRDKTEAAYQRGDMLDRRRRLMDAWDQYCRTDRAARGNAVPLHRRARP